MFFRWFTCMKTHGLPKFAGDGTTHTGYCGQRLHIEKTLYANATNTAYISGNWSATLLPNTNKLPLGDEFLQIQNTFRTSDTYSKIGNFEVSIKGTINLTSGINITLSSYTSVQSLIYDISSKS